MSAIAFKRFVEDCELSDSKSKFCQKAHLDQVSWPLTQTLTQPLRMGTLVSNMSLLLRRVCPPFRL